MNNFLGKVKRYVSRFKYFSKRIGFVNTYKAKMLKRKRNGYISLKLKGYKTSLIIRANTSDIDTFEQIFIRGDYDIDIDFKPKLIIDGGAYVGYSSVYFANRFPDAHIIAFEPAKSNFDILTKNTVGYKNITIHNSAIWSKVTSLAVKDEGLGEWGYLVKETNENTNNIKGTTIEEILNQSGHDTIDILKLDIEGSEVEIFSENYEPWINKVKALIVELHENIRPGCSEIFFNATRKYDFSYGKSGENEILISNVR